MTNEKNVTAYCTPSFFQKLLREELLSPEQIHSSCDGFFAVTKSLSDLLGARGITTFPNEQWQERRCDRFFDDWYLYAVADKTGCVYSLFKMREQEEDAAGEIPADGDTPGVTVSFLAFRTEILEACLSDPSPANRRALNRDVNRVVAAGGQTHHRQLKRYFCRPQAEGPYLIARLYVEHIAAFSQNGSLKVPVRYASLYRKSKTLPPSHPQARLPRFLEELNTAAGYPVCDHARIHIRDLTNLSPHEKLAILATHTANTSFHSFAAEVRYHACFLVWIMKIPIPFLGKSIYASAIRADMTIDDRELTGPAPYYRENSRWIRQQIRWHGPSDPA